eukprot:COSAG01_NODE_44525_length_418_cov_0.927900_1_plen_71_part_10
MVTDTAQLFLEKRLGGGCSPTAESVRGETRALRRTSAAWPQGCTPHPEHLQEQQQGEDRVKSMLFHMSGEG